MSEYDPSSPPGTPDDRELEAFLSRKSPLSQAYREALPHERVPDSIDVAVKAWAKREHDQHLGRRGRWWDRAALPLGAAASLILVALLVNKGRESGASEREAMREAATQEAARVEAPTNAVPGRAEPAAPATVPSAKPRDALARAESAGLSAAKSFRKQAGAPASPPEVAQSGPVSGPVAAAAASAPPPPPANVVEDASRESELPAAAAEDRPKAQAEQKVANAPAQRLDGVMASAGTGAVKAAEVPSAPAPLPAMAEPAPAPAPFPATPTTAAPFTGTAAEKMQEPLQTAIASNVELLDCDRVAQGSALDPRSYPASPAWLGGIRSLRATGQSDAAQRQLQCWQRVNPQSPVPDDLKVLLAPP